MIALYMIDELGVFPHTAKHAGDKDYELHNSTRMTIQDGFKVKWHEPEEHMGDVLRLKKATPDEWG